MIKLAKKDMHMNNGRKLAVVTPRPIESKGCRWFEYFPAAGLFAKASRVVTGAGYNIMAEMRRFEEKHLAVAFERKYDDQKGRLAGSQMSPQNGAHKAAKYIVSLL